LETRDGALLFRSKIRTQWQSFWYESCASPARDAVMAKNLL
jgi:hypothetical protein